MCIPRTEINYFKTKTKTRALLPGYDKLEPTEKLQVFQPTGFKFSAYAKPKCLGQKSLIDDLNLCQEGCVVNPEG